MSRFHCTCIPCEAKTQMSSFFLLPNTWAVFPAHRTGTCSSSVQQKPQGRQHDFYGFSLNIWSGHQMQCPKSHRDTLSGRYTTKRKLPVIKTFLCIITIVLIIVITLPSSPAFFRYRWNLLLTVPRAQMMIGTSTTSSKFHRCLCSLFKSWYFFLFFKT